MSVYAFRISNHSESKLKEKVFFVSMPNVHVQNNASFKNNNNNTHNNNMNK